ncbi:MAG: FAD-dependent oxidoreductase [Candidatus Yanofskybacteria bacterium]|nr:FAD-dependent oxidoreductase [Candidatus Yanofskybacteria bacterium]
MFDLIIIGGSAAATAAGIYAARRNLNFKIITKDFGGEIATSGEIANWPGIIKTDGITLAKQFREHLESYKVQIEEGVEVDKITKMSDGTYCITAKSGAGPKMAAEKLSDGQKTAELKCDYAARVVIVATGVRPRELNVPGEKEFRNKGVSYCTVCDGPLFAGKAVAIVGGGNSALESALMMADIAQKVYVVNKNSQFNGDQILIDNLKFKKNVEIIYNADTTHIIGNEFVAGLKYTRTVPTETSEELKIDGIFVHIGMLPNSGMVSPEVAKNQTGEIIVDKNCQTNIPGLYAAGDVTDIPHKQIVISAGQGSCAVLSAVNYLNKLK